jgi:hypothetical protein
MGADTFSKAVPLRNGKVGQKHGRSASASDALAKLPVETVLMTKKLMEKFSALTGSAERGLDCKLQ